MLLPLFKVRNHTQFCADLGEQVTAANHDDGLSGECRCAAAHFGSSVPACSATMYAAYQSFHGRNASPSSGVKCWRQWRFSSYVVMRDMYGCDTRDEFYIRAKRERTKAKENSKARKKARIR
jgi:hypothetical protein